MVLLGCSLGPDADDEPRLVRTVLDRPPEYAGWWLEVQACSGLIGHLGQVRFLEVVQPVLADGRQFPCGGGQYCNGMWEAPHDISLAPRYVHHERLVKHEMLHELVRTPGHPPVFQTCDATWGSTFEVVPDGLP